MSANDENFVEEPTKPIDTTNVDDLFLRFRNREKEEVIVACGKKIISQVQSSGSNYDLFDRIKDPIEDQKKEDIL